MDGFDARADVAPEFAQVVDCPDGVSKVVQALLADGGHAVIFERSHGGRLSVVFGDGHDAFQRGKGKA